MLYYSYFFYLLLNLNLKAKTEITRKIKSCFIEYYNDTEGL